jgi:hypothetical protein
MFMGDGKSSDMLCCRIPNYRQARTSRACYTQFNKLGTPRGENAPRRVVDCNWALQIQQSKLLVGCQAAGKEYDDKLTAALAKVSTVRVDSPLFRLCYGKSPYGQYFACTVDMMHAYEHGVVVYVLKAFVEPISGPKKNLIDTLVRQMFATHRCSERDTYPRTNFTKGVTHLKLMKCYEWPGFLFVFLILAQSYKGSEILKSRMDDKDAAFSRKITRLHNKKEKKKTKQKSLRRLGYSIGFDNVSADDDDGLEAEIDEESVNSAPINDSEMEIPDAEANGAVEAAIGDDGGFNPRCTTENFATLVSQLLTFHAYYKQKSFWKKTKSAQGEQDLNNAMMVMLRQLRNTLSRDTGYGWNIHKVHEVFFHLVRQIRETGRPSNSDCQVGERGLKVWGKHDAQRTNKGNINSFNKQLTQRVYEQYVMQRAQIGMDFISKKMTFHEDATEEITETSFMVGRPKYKVYLQCRESQRSHAEQFFLQLNGRKIKNELAQSHCRSLLYRCLMKSISLRTKSILSNLSVFA